MSDRAALAVEAEEGDPALMLRNLEGSIDPLCSATAEGMMASGYHNTSL